MKTLDKKAFFFDFDGTIWFGRYGEKTLQALKDLHNKGHLLFYNSGRSKANSTHENLSKIPFDGFLYGGCHAENSNGKTIYLSNISQEAIKDAIETEEKYDLLIIYEGTDRVCKRKGILDWIPCEELEYLSLLEDTNLYPMSKFSIFKRKKDDGYEPVPQEALEKLSKHYIVIEMGNYVECVQKGHGKDFLIKKVCKELDINIEDTYAFGDSMNDLPMFKTCAKAVAIGHAPDQLKAYAVYVTKEEENGVWEALKELGFVD